jgi:hypothetical protein
MPKNSELANWSQEVHNRISRELEKARDRMKKYADQRRKQEPHYQVRDLVMLNGRNIKTRRPSRKLDHKLYGPFQVEKLISPSAVRLTLPRKWRIHNVFHVSLLEPYNSGGRTLPDPAKVLREADDIECTEEYDVEEVMGSSRTKSRVLYLVRWSGFPKKEEWTWEPYDNFSVGGLEKIHEFHRAHPDSPRDYRLISAT